MITEHLGAPLCVSEEPFPHFVLDDYLSPEQTADMRCKLIEYPGWKPATRAGKQSIRRGEDWMLSICADLLNRGQQIIAKHFDPEASGWVLDKTYAGSNVHRMEKGGSLGLHVDFNLVDEPKANGCRLWRRWNLFLYLNRHWNGLSLGTLELAVLKDGGRGHEIATQIEPIGGRLVGLENGPSNWHGVTTPWAEDRPRLSFAMNLYSRDQPEGVCPIPHTTIPIRAANPDVPIEDFERRWVRPFVEWYRSENSRR